MEDLLSLRISDASVHLTVETAQGGSSTVPKMVSPSQMVSSGGFWSAPSAFKPDIMPQSNIIIGHGVIGQCKSLVMVRTTGPDVSDPAWTVKEKVRQEERHLRSMNFESSFTYKNVFPPSVSGKSLQILYLFFAPKPIISSTENSCFTHNFLQLPRSIVSVEAPCGCPMTSCGAH